MTADTKKWVSRLLFFFSFVYFWKYLECDECQPACIVV